MRSRRSGSWLRPAFAAVALGATGNVVVGWLAARRADLNVGHLLVLPLFWLAVLFALAPWITHAARLYIWADFLGRPLPFTDVFRIMLGSEVGSALTPPAAGGGYLKVALLIERGYPAGVAASLMVLGSVEDYAFFLAALPLVLLALPGPEIQMLHPVANWLAGHLALPGAIVGSAVVIVLLFRRSITRRLGRLWHDFAGVFRVIAQRGKLRFAATFGLVALQWTCRYAATALLLRSLGIPLNPLLVFLLQWVVFAAALVVPTPGGMVGAEAAFYVVYRAFVPAAVLPAAVAAWRLLTFYGPLGLAALGFTALQWRWRLPRPLPLQREPGAA